MSNTKKVTISLTPEQQMLMCKLFYNVLRLGVGYFALQTLQVYHNFNRQNNSTKPLLVAGAV